MTTTAPGRQRAAQLLLWELRRRSALSEGVGILQVWQICGSRQARTDLLAEHGRRDQNAEADRMIAVVDAAAEGRSDPDVSWD
jgi:hypothetical protein